MKWFGFFCEFLFLHGASHLIFSSKTAVDYFKPFHINHKSRSIVNPAPKVLSKRKTSIRKDVRKLLFVGQVRQWKGLDILLKALAKLTDMNLYLDVAGMYDNESKYYRMLNELIQKNNLEKKVHFHGNLSRQDLAALYRQADIFILPSRYETYGMVLLEAMSFGLPIIASTIPSAKQIIKDQVNGIFFENNDPDSLAQAIHQLYFDKNKRVSIRRNNLKVSGTLRTWSTVTEETYRAISEFL
jgi:glycosyltransferase involved in cell wall biosynthesis